MTHEAALPIYGPETKIVWGKAGLRTAWQRNGDTLVRHTRLVAPGFSTLTEALEKADSSLETIAKACGASVIHHIWGLYNAGRKQPHEVDQLLPRNHILVAEVDIIRSVTTVRKNQKLQIDQALESISKVSEYGGLVYEAGHFQFINGIAPGDDDTKLWLVDIEPILC